MRELATALLAKEKQGFASPTVPASVFDTPGGRHYHTAPMSGPRAEEVDVALLASQGGTIDREYPLTGFGRVQDLLPGVAGIEPGAVRARFVFARENGRPVADVQVNAELPLICQRCLQPMLWAISSSATLAFVNAVKAGAEEIDGRDVFQAPGGQVALRAVVEEELLLALPLVATHSRQSDCAEIGRDDTHALKPTRADAQRPFAKLRELLGRK